MNTEEVGKKLVELCRKDEWMKAVEGLYALKRSSTSFGEHFVDFGERNGVGEGIELASRGDVACGTDESAPCDTSQGRAD